MSIGQDRASGAAFSNDRRYRFALWRTIGDPLPLLPPRRIAWIGLNPSTADEKDDDATIRRCIGFSKRWGFSELVMLNAYAYRDTDPTGLQASARIHGLPDPYAMRVANDAAIAEEAARCEVVVCCWGTHVGALEPGRGAAIVNLLKRCAPAAVCCLGTNLDGSPKHPLYQPNAATLRPYPPPVTP
jgi:hypothetical protein